MSVTKASLKLSHILIISLVQRNLYYYDKINCFTPVFGNDFNQLNKLLIIYTKTTFNSIKGTHLTKYTKKTMNITHSPFFVWIGLITLTLFILIPGLKTLPTTDRDEAYFVQATRQMLQTGNYFQIRFQEQTRFQKPPGINWLQALSVSLISEPSSSQIWAYRLPSLLGGLFSVLLLYYFSKRYVDNKTAILASGLLSCSLLFVVESHLAVIDSALLVSVMLMQGALLIIYMEKQTVSFFWPTCFWFAMAFGFLLKGVTPLIGLLSLCTLLFVDRDHSWLKQLYVVWGVVLFIILTLLWVIPVNMAEHSNYLLQLFYKDLLPKLQGSHQSHGQPPLFHLAILLITLWPGSVFLFHAILYAWVYRKQRLTTFLLAWLIPIWVFFEIMPTKLPQYVLPTFPVIALLIALGVREWNGRLAHKYLNAYLSLWFIVTILLAVACVVLPYLLIRTIDVYQIILVSSIIIISAGIIYWIKGGLCYQASFGIIILSLVYYPILFTKILPGLKPLWMSASIAQKTPKNRVKSKMPLLVAGYAEPSLVFNFNTNLIKFTNNYNAFMDITKHQGQLLLIDSSEWNAISKSTHQQSVVLERFPGFNYNKGRWTELVLIDYKKNG